MFNYKTYWKIFETREEAIEFFTKINACEDVISIKIIPLDNAWRMEWEVEIE